jgi:hypothetical protein
MKECIDGPQDARSSESQWGCHAPRPIYAIYSFLHKGMVPVFTVVLHINYGAYRDAIKIIAIRSRKDQFRRGKASTADAANLRRTPRKTNHSVIKAQLFRSRSEVRIEETKYATKDESVDLGSIPCRPIWYRMPDGTCWNISSWSGKS